LQQGRVDLGEAPKADHGLYKTLPISTNWCRNEPTRATTWSLVRTPNPLTRGNHFACLVEAVGIEPSSVDPVSHDSVAITRNDLDADTPLKPSESEFVDQLGTRVLKLWGVLRVV